MSTGLYKVCQNALSSLPGLRSTQWQHLMCRTLRYPVVLQPSSQYHRTAWLRSEALSTEARSANSKDVAFSLRPYQEECIEECLAAIKSGVTRIGVSSPTGSGKTTIFTHLIDRLPPRARGGDRVLIIVNSIELAIQAADSMTAAFPDKSVEIEQGSKYNATGFADVTVATYQTLNRSRERLEKFDPDSYKAIVVDEAHHAAAPSYLKVLSYFDPRVGLEQDAALKRHVVGNNSTPTDAVPVVGFSATFSRHDGLALGKVFDRIVFHKDFLEMIGEKWLCPIRFTSIKADLDLASVKLSSFQADFAASSLASVVNTPIVNRIVLKAWIDKAYGQRKSTLIFAVNIDHVQDLTQMFRQAGIDARYLHGGTPVQERRQLLQDFRNGLFPVLVNCAILIEGADVPSIDCVLLARPTRSRNLFSQMIGRGLRLSPKTGKKDCLILDIVGNVEQGVVCTPTLFGLSIDEDIEDETSESLLERNVDADISAGSPDPTLSPESFESHLADPTKVLYVDYDDPFHLQKAMMSRSSIVETMSPNAWVDCGNQHFVLEVPRYGFVRVERAEDTDQTLNTDASQAAKWTSWYTASNRDVDESMASQGRNPSSLPFGRSRKWIRGTSPYRKPRHVLLATDLESAIRGSDLYVKKTILRNSMQLYALLHRRASWRQAKASDIQRKLVEKRLGLNKQSAAFSSVEITSNKAADGSTEVNSKKRPHSNVDLSTLTKGQAGLLLTRLNHGAKTRWQQQAKNSNKALRLQEKERKRADRETVRVGPLASQ